MPSLRLLMHSLKLEKKENAVNYGKLAMLYRLAGGGPIVIYSSHDFVDVHEVYLYLQEICNNSKDLTLAKDAVVTGNPFLAHNLKEIAEKIPRGTSKKKNYFSPKESMKGESSSCRRDFTERRSSRQRPVKKKFHRS